MKTKSLSVVEVLDCIFDDIITNFPVRRIPESFACEIADDSDHHSTRKGAMVYKEVYVIPAGTISWVVARGKPTHRYLSDDYAGDIIAFKLPGSPQTVKEVFGTYGPPNMSFGGADKTQAPWSYFARSAIVAMARGQLAQSSRSRFPNIGPFVHAELKQEGPFFMTSISHRSDGCVSLGTFMPMPTDGYDRRLALVLAKAIKLEIQKG